MKENNEIFTMPMVYMPDGSPAPYILSVDEAIIFLRKHFKGKTKFKDYPKNDVPMEFFSKKLKRYLIKKENVKTTK